MIIFPNGMAMPGARYGVYPAESGNSELGRWMSTDPLAVKYPGCLPAEVPFYGTKEGSPYNHTLGNPVNLIDPDGNSPDEFDVDSQNGTVVKISDKGGKETDYYNIGTYNKDGKFETTQTWELS